MFKKKTKKHGVCSFRSNARQKLPNYHYQGPGNINPKSVYAQHSLAICNMQQQGNKQPEQADQKVSNNNQQTTSDKPAK